MSWPFGSYLIHITPNMTRHQETSIGDFFHCRNDTNGILISEPLDEVAHWLVSARCAEGSPTAFMLTALVWHIRLIPPTPNLHKFQVNVDCHHDGMFVMV